MAEIRHSSVYARSLKSQNPEPKKEKMFKIFEVADRLRCSKSFIYKMMDEGKLDFITLGEKTGNGSRKPPWINLLKKENRSGGIKNMKTLSIRQPGPGWSARV